MRLGALSPLATRLGGGETLESTYLREIQAALGDGFTQSLDGPVGVENICDARLFASIFKASERMRTQTLPGKSTDALNDWIVRLGIVLPNDSTDQTKRQEAAAKYTALIGPTVENLSNSLNNLLGDKFISVDYTYTGDLENPPEPTYWQDNPGPTDKDMGGSGGTWSSQRQVFVVSATVADTTDVEAMKALSQSVDKLLDNLAHVCSKWTFNANEFDGFHLDIDPMDFTAFD